MLLSAAIIAQDNESTIERVVANAARIADEVIVVDGGSQDATFELARRQPKCRALQRTFDDFATQKNHAIQQARGRWVLILDSDELLGARSLRYLRACLRVPALRWYKLRTCHLVRERGCELQVHSARHYPDSHLRLFRNRPPFRYDVARGRVHESFPRTGRGPGARLPFHIFHYGYGLKSIEERRERIAMYERIGGGVADTNRMYLWEEDPGVRLITPRESPPKYGLIDG